MCSATLVDDIHKIFPFCWIYHKLESGKRPKAFLNSSVYETYAINTTKINSHKCVYILNWIRKNVCIVGYSKRRTRMKKQTKTQLRCISMYLIWTRWNEENWIKFGKIAMNTFTKFARIYATSSLYKYVQFIVISVFFFHCINRNTFLCLFYFDCIYMCTSFDVIHEIFLYVQTAEKELHLQECASDTHLLLI